MASHPSGAVSGVEYFTDADQAVAYIEFLYQESGARMRAAFDAVSRGESDPVAEVDVTYPYVGMEIGPAELNVDARLSHGAVQAPGVYGTTLTRPELFRDYYREQIALLIRHHGVPVLVARGNRSIPLPFLIEDSTAELSERQLRAIQEGFTLPDLANTDDEIANGTRPRAAEPLPMALFGAERVDYSLARLSHYTATTPGHFQRFILLTNYQRYVDAFRAHGRAAVARGEGYEALIEPGDVVTARSGVDASTLMPSPAAHLPQMPAYHLTRADRNGITLINIGVGPSNAKTITDHLAVLRPHCWIMLGHCAGLRRSQYLGDYVLAHGYVREDHVLDQDLPGWVPVPPIAEVQVALQDAVAKVTGLRGSDLKTRMRTGTVATTDNRNWELRYGELYQRLNQSRAIAVDMESATVAANGFRFRVPYGTLLCVSDKPLHGEIKLRGMANALYRERINQHLMVGIETCEMLRENGPEQLHSRKLRSFDDPPFR